MAQTAVEWFDDKIRELDVDFETTIVSRKTYWIKRKELLEQAKKMEKQQIIVARMDGMTDDELSYQTAEQYYNETYK